MGKARRMCHGAEKVQGYRRQHCSRIREWRSQAKLCCEPTMCVREGERKRVRAGGGARAGEGRVGVGRGEQGEAGVREGAQARSSRAEKPLLSSCPAAPPPARFAPRLTLRAWTPLPVPLATAPRKGSEGPPEKNPKRSIPLRCKLLFSVLGAIPPPSLAFFP